MCSFDLPFCTHNSFRFSIFCTHKHNDTLWHTVSVHIKCWKYEERKNPFPTQLFLSCEEVASCLTIERVTHFMKHDLYTFRMNARTRTHSTHDEHSIVPFPNMEVTFCQSNHCNGYYKLKCHGWTVLLRAALIHTYIKSQIFLRKSEKKTPTLKWNEIKLITKYITYTKWIYYIPRSEFSIWTWLLLFDYMCS